MVNNNLLGGWPTPLKNDGLRQLGLRTSQYDGKVIKFHGSSHHQPDRIWTRRLRIFQCQKLRAQAIENMKIVVYWTIRLEENGV